MRKVQNRGFTLIELVIVIAIIAILAVGIIAALNPVEQSNRATDARMKNTMSELMGGIQRYGATMLYPVFCKDGSSCGNVTGPLPFTAIQDNNAAYVLGKLIGNNEITSNFTTATWTDLQNIQGTFSASNNSSVSLCYQPYSVATKSDTTMTRYLKTGVPAAANTCKPDSTNTCYWCVIQ